MEQHHERRRSKKYRLILVPENGGADSTRSFLLHPLALIGGGLVLFFLTALIVIALLAYTPVGTLVPIPTSQIQRRYQRQIQELEERLQTLAESVNRIQEYNAKLRKVMGEPVEPSDRPANGVRTSDREQAITPGFGSNQPEASIREPGRSPASERAPRAEQSAAEPQGIAARPVISTIPLSQPVGGYITQRFLPSSGHFGIDVAAARGTIVTAAADGTVLFAGWTYDEGNVVIISHPGDMVTFYKHNESLLVRTGETVRRGRAIAQLGDSGRTSMGPHLHFEVWVNGHPVDPATYVLRYR